MWFVLVIACVVFLFGLVQWARSGAVMVDIYRLLKQGIPSDTYSADDPEKNAKEMAGKKERERFQKTIHKMESITDALLESSFRILGLLALCVWIFVAFSVVVDLLGLDWLSNFRYSANRVWGTPVTRSGYNNSQSGGTTRNNFIRSMGSGVRR